MEHAHVKRTVDIFRERFGQEPRVFRAPGRVNLIGEHTDYNDGFVLPFAIDRETITAAAPRGDTKVNVYAVDVDEAASFDLSAAPVKRRGTWLDYVEGTIRALGLKCTIRNGFDIAFSSTVPIGAGLSSSAALEVSVGSAILAIAHGSLDRQELGFAAQSAEHEYVGTRSGIMDQFASVFATEGHAMLLDCRSLEIRQIRLETDGTMIAVCDTGVKHDLAASEYNRRREECETGVKILERSIPGLSSLRDVTEGDLEKFGHALPPVIAKRCRHVVAENVRTLAAAGAVTAGEAKAAGRFMFASHRSLRDDYEVSCPELDLLVDIAGGVDGVWGARMTGGGFGGCTVNLLASAAFNEFKRATQAGYEERFGRIPPIYVFEAAAGASEIAASFFK